MNITLLTDVLPDDTYTSGQSLRNMLRALNATQISVLWINQSSLKPPPDDPLYTVAREYRFALSKRTGMFWYWLTQRLNPASLATTAIQLLITVWLCFKIAASILMTRRRNTDYVWMVLQGEKLLLVYMIIALFDRRRIILHQWDPLSWWMQHRNHRPALIRLMSKGLEWLQRRVWLNVVPSPQWEKRLVERGCKAVRVCHFFQDDELRPASPMIKLHTPGTLNVVFLGQLYANAELERCLDVLRRTATRLSMRIVLHYFGAGSPSGRAGVEIVAYGYQTRMDVIAAIGKWDLALLPYPCDPRYAETAQLSFPSKSRLYLAAGLPILAYAPARSSVNEFFSEHYRPYYVNAGLDEDLDSFIEHCIAFNPLHVRRRREHAYSVVKRWFSADAEIGNLVRLLSQ